MEQGLDMSADDREANGAPALSLVSVGNREEGGKRRILPALEELKAWPQWVTHAHKVPHNPATGLRASVADASTWTNFVTAARARKRLGHAGLSFVLTV